MRLGLASPRTVALAVAASVGVALALPYCAVAQAPSKPPASASENGTKTPEGGTPRKKPQTSEARPEATPEGADPNRKADAPARGRQDSKPGDRSGPPDKARRGRPPMMVGVDTVTQGPLQRTDPVIGRLVLRQGGVIAARIAGPVESIRVQVGDRVKEGDVIAALNTDTAAAKLSFQKAELRIAQQELARLEALRAGGSMAFAKAKYEDAQQKLARAKANVRLAEIALSDAVIRAPYPGVVTKRHTDLGAYLNVGASVVTMINIDAVEIEADVPSDRVAGLRPGIEVRFELEGNKDLTAKVRAVVPEENALTRTLAVRLVPDFGEAEVFRAVNQPVTIRVPAGAPRTVVSVHKDAVINRGDSNMVYVAADGKAMPRPVQLGEAFGSRFEVLTGLKPGELVVVRGNERLRPMQPIRYPKRS